MRYFRLFILVLTLTTFGLSQTAHAQKNTLNHWEVRAGLGLLPTFMKDHSKTELQPISLEVRYRPNKKFSLGLLAGNSISQSYQTHHTGESRMVRNHFKMLALRGAVHTSPYEKWDLYGGVLLAYTDNKIDYTQMPEDKEDGPSFFPVAKTRDGIFFSAFIGTSYQVHNRISLFGELSYGLSLATIGTSVSF